MPRKLEERPEAAPSIIIPGFDKRFHQAMEGWDNPEASADDLVGICARLKGVYAGLTWADLTKQKEFSFSPSSPSYFRREQLLRAIEELKTGDKKIAESLPALYQKTDSRQDVLLSALKDVQNRSLVDWFNYAISEGTPEQQANAIFIVFNTENPFLFINPPIQELIDRMHNSYASDMKSLSGRERDKLGRFFQEIFFTVRYRGIHDWSYASTVCRETVEILADEKIGSLLYRDFCRYVHHDRFLYPPHLFQWNIMMKSMYPKERSFAGLLAQFYKEHPEGIYKYFGKVNIIISALSRLGEGKHMPGDNWIGDDPDEDILLSLFSGPPVISALEAEQAGFKKVVTVDAASLEELRPLAMGGKALLLLTELLPGCKQIVDDDDEYWPEDEDIRLEHLQLTIPKDLEQLESLVDFDRVTCVEDKRGGLLYLPPEEQILYLRWLMGKLGGKSRYELILSRGLTTSLVNYLELEKNNNELRIMDCDTVLPIFFPGGSMILDIERRSISLSEAFILTLHDLFPSYDEVNYWDKIYIFAKAFSQMVNNHIDGGRHGDSISSDFGIEEELSGKVDHPKMIHTVAEIFDWFFYHGEMIEQQIKRMDMRRFNIDEQQILEWFNTFDANLLVRLIPLGLAEAGLTNLLQGILHPRLSPVPEVLRERFKGRG